MKENLSELVFILDRSGSMGGLVDDTIGGFNSMIEEQKQKPGEAYVTTILFDHDYDILHDHVNVQQIQPITRSEYFARGTTALLDAIGRAINSIGRRLDSTPEEERPSKVIFVITTDGHENASKEFEKSQVKEMIEHQQNKYSWMFMFLGANMDAIGEAVTLGINTDFANTYSASSIGTQSVYKAVSAAVGTARGADSNAMRKGETGYQIVMDTLKNEVQ